MSSDGTVGQPNERSAICTKLRNPIGMIAFSKCLHFQYAIKGYTRLGFEFSTPTASLELCCNMLPAFN